ncbi:MAG: DNA-binding protein [Lachnospiraceae bacterium]|jgi:predicted DNA-binding protein with PD1-like motif|nr:DNA-binding protein [Lachnospiraceae bacterium]MCI8959184.1 DNA-binding protein [Lachnospiraceae bacterium]
MKGLYEVTVDRGEDIRQVLSDYILEKNWEEVFIVGAIGSIIDSAYNAPADNRIPMNLVTVECPEAAELLSFHGEVMKRERMDENLARVYRDKTSPLFIHIHASCAAGGGAMYGGGLVKGRAFRSIRIFMIPL